MSDITLDHARRMLAWTSKQLLEHMTSVLCLGGCPDCQQTSACQAYWMDRAAMLQEQKTLQTEMARLVRQQEEEQA